MTMYLSDIINPTDSTETELGNDFYVHALRKDEKGMLIYTRIRSIDNEVADFTRKDGTPYLKQYRWRCTFRDAYYVCLLLWPHAHTKLEKINQVIAHYQDSSNANVINIDDWRKVN